METGNILKDRIVEELTCFKSDNSYCSDCGRVNSEQMLTDNETVIQILSKGIIGRNFCVIKENDAVFNKNELILVNYDGFTEIAVVEEIGEIVKYRRHCVGMRESELPEYYKKLNEADQRHYERNITDEIKAKEIFRNKTEEHKLEMKLVDIHYQFDRKKLFFFYTAEGRVDFRELAKSLAGEFKTRIELRQIGVRDEAKRIGGLGVCGLEYCCTAFLSNFKRITAQLANDQNASANLSKLSGPCGKLKCCLSFEME